MQSVLTKFWCLVSMNTGHAGISFWNSSTQMARCVQHRLPIVQQHWCGGGQLRKLRHCAAAMGVARVPRSCHGPRNHHDNGCPPNPGHSKQLSRAQPHRSSQKRLAQSAGPHCWCGTRIATIDWILTGFFCISF